MLPRPRPCPNLLTHLHLGPRFLLPSPCPVSCQLMDDVQCPAKGSLMPVNRIPHPETSWFSAFPVVQLIPRVPGQLWVRYSRHEPSQLWRTNNPCREEKGTYDIRTLQGLVPATCTGNFNARLPSQVHCYTLYHIAFSSFFTRLGGWEQARCAPLTRYTGSSTSSTSSRTTHTCPHPHTPRALAHARSRALARTRGISFPE